MLVPLYDVNKTFEENADKGPFFSDLLEVKSPRTPILTFLGLPLCSPIGVAPCPLTLGKGISLLSKLEFDVLIYKTIRCMQYPVHSFPNLYVMEDSPGNITVANSFGIGCAKPEVVLCDIEKAKSSLSAGQILIVSIYGEGKTRKESMQQFYQAAAMAKDAGAHIVEANLSCPNLLHTTALYLDIEYVEALTSRLVAILGNIPLTVKVGVFPTLTGLRQLLYTLAKIGVQGICGINSVSQPIYNKAGAPIFGPDREKAGVSGSSIRPLALSFVQNVKSILEKEKLSLKLLATGGVTQAHHFREFLEAGADIALSATGAMWNPYLAMEYHRGAYDTKRITRKLERNADY